jgi:hypothetical protein
MRSQKYSHDGERMTKHESDKLERLVLSMSKLEYWQFIGWLSNGTEGPLWDLLKRDRRKPAAAEKVGHGTQP